MPTKPKPFLKWAGGKSHQLNYIRPVVEVVSPDIYVEPFLGGGSVFFGISDLLDDTVSYLNDANKELITTYRAVRATPKTVMKHLDQYEISEEEYYAVRSIDWRTLEQSEAGARMIYLNKTCFNGLYRTNKDGMFNVPWGKRKNVKLYDENNLIACSKALRRALLYDLDFFDFLFLTYPHVAVNAIEFGAPVLYYYDPPYATRDGFTQYLGTPFDNEKERKLFYVIRFLREHCGSCYQLISNVYGSFLTNLILDHYKNDVYVVSMDVAYRINQQYRKTVPEVLIFIPPKDYDGDSPWS